MRRLLFESDWLGSRPVFYHDETGQASHNINDVVNAASFAWHPDGLNNYLEFGYSVVEQTPVNHVKVLRHSARLWRDDSGTVSVEYLDDPVDRWLDHRLSEDDVIELIRARVRQWERSVDGEIVIPTSGGYDSRLLNWCVEDKTRIRTFTYGTSEHQADSHEVAYACRLSEILGTRWAHIPLGEFHRYFDEWDRLFGVSAHAHGMYHVEFYTKLLPSVAGGNPFLSGVIGDAWAGSVNVPELQGCADVRQLSYSHGIQAESAQSMFPAAQSLLSSYWNAHRHRLADPRLRIIEAMRFKLMLLSYLRIVPESFGFRWWSPFLDIDIAMAMLNLPPDRRLNRVWQTDFFRRVGLDLEAMALSSTRQNILDLQALRTMPVQPLDATLLSDVVRPGYVQWINHHARFAWHTDVVKGLLGVRKIGGGLKRLGVSDSDPDRLKAYNAYLVLRPLESLLKRRDAARRVSPVPA